MLPDVLQSVARLNPFFYFIDGIRYAMIGVNESNLLFGAVFIVGLIVALGWFVWYLFRIGYGIRE